MLLILPFDAAVDQALRPSVRPNQRRVRRRRQLAVPDGRQEQQRRGRTPKQALQEDQFDGEEQERLWHLQVQKRQGVDRRRLGRQLGAVGHQRLLPVRRDYERVRNHRRFDRQKVRTRSGEHRRACVRDRRHAARHGASEDHRGAAPVVGSVGGYGRTAARCQVQPPGGGARGLRVRFWRERRNQQVHGLHRKVRRRHGPGRNPRGEPSRGETLVRGGQVRERSVHHGRGD